MSKIKKAIFIFFFASVGSHAESIFVGWPSERANVSTINVEGNTFFYGTANQRGGLITFSVDVKEDGWYRIYADTIAPNDFSNSFLVTLPGENTARLWNLPVSSESQINEILLSGSFDSLIYLEKGVNLFNFEVVEEETKIADMILELEPESLASGYPSSTVNMKSEVVEGNTFFYGTGGAGKIGFKVHVRNAGFYKLEANVIAAEGSSNSFRVNEANSSQVWHLQKNSKPSFQEYGRVYLHAGENEIIFNERESYTKIADIRVSRVIEQRYENQNVYEAFAGFDSEYTGLCESYTLDKLVNDLGIAIGYQSVEEERNCTINDTLRTKLLANLLTGYGGTVANISLSPASGYTLSYDIRFDEAFEWKLGGKLPGLQGGETRTGGTSGSDGLGWSVRLVWAADGYINPYVYHKDQPGKYGDSLGGKNLVKLSRGEWYNLEIFVKVNTEDNFNGKLTIKLNGREVFYKNDLRFATELGAHYVNSLGFHIFRGGSSQDYISDLDGYIYIDNLRIEKLP